MNFNLCDPAPPPCIPGAAESCSRRASPPCFSTWTRLLTLSRFQEEEERREKEKRCTPSGRRGKRENPRTVVHRNPSGFGVWNCGLKCVHSRPKRADWLDFEPADQVDKSQLPAEYPVQTWYAPHTQKR
ncbi:Hypothetical predicted protein [Xyrichtys novacula]|uniref:Uncharacterized protein n=1 Tax=Xyrichtys novacula TaxID=13765 RepID=A0AAV1ETA5_XYRNO|nr:Hypothetical predicted protein [Xyrichtys novacula]